MPQSVANPAPAITPLPQNPPAFPRRAHPLTYEASECLAPLFAPNYSAIVSGARWLKVIGSLLTIVGAITFCAGTAALAYALLSPDSRYCDRWFRLMPEELPGAIRLVSGILLA